VARQPGWAHRVCGRPWRTRRVSAVRFQQMVSEPGWPSAFSDKSRLTMCEGEIIGNSPTLSGENGKAWFIWLRVATPIRLAFWGECWPKRPKARCYTCGRVCRGPTAWVGAPCVRTALTDTLCVGGPVPTKFLLLVFKRVLRYWFWKYYSLSPFWTQWDTNLKIISIEKCFLKLVVVRSFCFGLMLSPPLA
jgi:hypothetical protein